MSTLLDLYKKGRKKKVVVLRVNRIDGVITTFAIVSSTTGSSLDRNVVLLLGIANLVADGLSMGLSDYVSSQSEYEYILNERKREEWEVDNFLEGEKQEMIDLYHNKGMTVEDAETVINAMYVSFATSLRPLFLLYFFKKSSLSEFEYSSK